MRLKDPTERLDPWADCLPCGHGLEQATEGHGDEVWCRECERLEALDEHERARQAAELCAWLERDD